MSFLGVDLLNKGQRKCRLLGCDVTYLTPLPKVGSVLQYKSTLDKHASYRDSLLIFYHCDCSVGNTPVFRIQNGQGGFFRDQEIENASGIDVSLDGLPWTDTSELGKRLSPQTSKTTFSDEDIQAYLKGDLVTCFGEEIFSLTKTHTQTSRTQSGNMNFMHRIIELDFEGGPQKRGYLCGECTIRPDDWFFKAHFKNDPCMPGVLIVEGCAQMVAFFATAMGLTLNRDEWRFEPVLDHAMTFQFRGEVGPGTQTLVYKIYIDRIVAGPVPMVFAHAFCLRDGLEIFLGKNLGLRLVPPDREGEY